MSKDQDLGYLFVFSDPMGSEITDDVFHDWYDRDHLPPRLEVPGFYSGVRYKAIDSQSPRFAASYEHKLGTLQTDAYKKLFAERSDLEAKIFEVCYLSRREYKLLSTHGKAEINKPAKVIVYAGVTPQKGKEQEFCEWYVESHLPLVQRVPGWIGARRFEKINESGDGTKYLVVHEYENGDWQTGPEFRAAMEQAIDWMGKNLDETAVKERRVLQRMYD
jgi:hypothetical protein